MKNKTIAYYDDPHNAYADLTVHADMSAIYARFQKYLTPGAAILDAGCGSGRDSLHFMKMGYAVTAIDASKEMCAYASLLLQQEVRQCTFQELDDQEAFSGIWACASLLHVPERQQAEVLQRLIRALTPGGVLYASWKYGETERIEAASGRLFCDMTEQRIETLVQSVEGVQIAECWISEDVRADRRSQKWMNGIFRKRSCVGSPCANPEALEKFYREGLEERLITQLAKVKNYSLEQAMDIYYHSRLAQKIYEGLYDIQYLDYKVLVDILLDMEPELFACP